VATGFFPPASLITPAKGPSAKQTGGMDHYDSSS
jgi:hypothetical protein